MDDQQFSGREHSAAEAMRRILVEQARPKAAGLTDKVRVALGPERLATKLAPRGRPPREVTPQKSSKIWGWSLSGGALAPNHSSRRGGDGNRRDRESVLSARLKRADVV